MAEPSSSRMKRRVPLNFSDSSPISKKALEESDVVVISDVEEESQDLLSHIVCDFSDSNDSSNEEQVETSEELLQRQIFERDVRCELKAMLDSFREEMEAVFEAKKRQLQMNGDASVSMVNQKIETAWKSHGERRQKTCKEFSQEFLKLFDEWTRNVQKTKEEEEKLALLVLEQKKTFQQITISQTERLKKAHDLYSEYLKSLEDLDKVQEHYFTNKHGTLKKEMSLFKDKIMMESHKQELALIRTSLQSMLF